MLGPSTQAHPRLSVIVVAGYKRPYLPDCIASIQRSSLDRSLYEIVLAMGFAEPEWESRFQASGVRLLRCPPGLKEAEMLCEAIPHARGDVLVFMEDDDEFDPEKLSHVEKLFRERPNLAFYNHDALAVDERGSEIGWIHSVNGFNLSSHCIRASLLRPFLPSLRHILVSPDHYIYWVGELFGEEALHEGLLLTHYRIHAGNFHVGKDPTEDLGYMFAIGLQAVRAGRPVEGRALRLGGTYLALRLVRALFGPRHFIPVARALSRLAWIRAIHTVVSRPGHPQGRPLMVTV